MGVPALGVPTHYPGEQYLLVISKLAPAGLESYAGERSARLCRLGRPDDERAITGAVSAPRAGTPAPASRATMKMKPGSTPEVEDVAGPNWLVLLLLGALAIQVLAAVGLIVAAFGMAMAWGWRSAMEPRPDGRWPLARKLMTAGAAVMLLALAEAAGLWFVPL